MAAQKTGEIDVLRIEPCFPGYLMKPTASQTQYVVPPQPFKVALDSPTDFVAVLVVPVVLAIAAGVFTVISNREQLKSSAASFRHTWQIDLRNALVSYIAAAQQMLVRTGTNARFPLSTDAEPVRTQMFTAQNTVLLMLDTEKQYAKDLKAKMGKTNDALFSVPPDTDVALETLQSVVEMSQEALEHAWQDIRRDLRIGKRKRGSRVGAG